ncbi:MAG: ATP synthase F1 subunit gamma, partial [Patescibacteria group bacterium]
KSRLKAVKNISQITKAMELVAATKMRRSQEIALASRPYAFAALEMLANLSSAYQKNQERFVPNGSSRAQPRESKGLPPLLEHRPVKTTAIVVVTSDKGLAGAFNSNVIRAFENFLKTENIRLNDPAYRFIAVGQKAARYLERRAGTLAAKFVRFGDYTTMEQIKPLTDTLLSGFVKGEWDRVIVFSMHFRSALKQEVVVRELLPIDFERIKQVAKEIIPETGRFADLMKESGVKFFEEGTREIHEEEYLIEPSPEEVLKLLVSHLVLMEIYHLVLEANASEHAARRTAMKNASDNAGELIDDLTLIYNKSRQAGITKELTELTAGAEALK